MSSKTIVPILTALLASAALIGYAFYRRHTGHVGPMSATVWCVFFAVVFVVPAIYDILCRLRGQNKGKTD